MKTFLSISLLAVLLIGCATNTGDTAKDARGRATNQALSEAGKVLGNIAVSALFNAAQQEASGGKVDFASAASEGLWRNAGSIISSGTVERIINAYSGDKLPKTAYVAASVADDKGTSPRVTNAIAAVISTAAGAPPK